MAIYVLSTRDPWKLYINLIAVKSVCHCGQDAHGRAYMECVGRVWLYGLRPRICLDNGQFASSKPVLKRLLTYNNIDGWIVTKTMLSRMSLLTACTDRQQTSKLCVPVAW